MKSLNFCNFEHVADLVIISAIILLVGQYNTITLPAFIVERIK